jgi:hypothetical protein
MFAIATMVHPTIAVAVTTILIATIVTPLLRMSARGIVYVPDFVANPMGIVNCANGITQSPITATTACHSFIISFTDNGMHDLSSLTALTAMPSLLL